MIESLEDRIIQLLLKQSRKVTYFCEVENISVNNCIHEIRKSLKRIRAWIEFYNETPNMRWFEEEIQQFKEQGKYLTLARESSVNLILFDKFFSNKQFLPEKKVKEIIEKLSAENHRLIEKLTTEKIFISIKNTSETFIQKLTLKNPVISEDQFLKILSESYLKGYEFYTSRDDVFNSENLHRLRIRLKMLWYQMETAKQTQAKFFTAKTRQLNDITEILGCDHDNYILLTHLQKCGYAILNNDDKKIVENLIHHQHELSVSAIAGKLKLFFYESPGEFNKRISSYIRKAKSVKTSG